MSTCAIPKLPGAQSPLAFYVIVGDDLKRIGREVRVVGGITIIVNISPNDGRV